MTERFSKWDAAEHLRTLEDARLYVQACADEDPGDGSLIRAALNDVARSGNMAGLAREAGMSREGLYKAFCRQAAIRPSRPSCGSRGALGLRLHIAWTVFGGDALRATRPSRDGAAGLAAAAASPLPSCPIIVCVRWLRQCDRAMRLAPATDLVHDVFRAGSRQPCAEDRRAARRQGKSSVARAGATSC